MQEDCGNAAVLLHHSAVTVPTWSWNVSASRKGGYIPAYNPTGFLLAGKAANKRTALIANGPRHAEPRTVISIH